MKHIFLFLTLVFLPIAAYTASDDSCDCPAVKCSNPCEESSGVTFYSEKCEGGKRVKSCAKPTCVPMLEPNNACLAFKKGQPVRNIASEEKIPKKAEEDFIAPKDKIANMHVVTGEVWVHNYKGEKHKAEAGMNLHEADVIKTGKVGSAKVKFTDGNEVNILPKTELKLTKVEVQAKNKKTVLDLIKGKVRNKVRQKYKGDESYYRVRTKAAVAGVRGTDFVVSYEVDGKAITKIQTIKGAVQLNDKSFSQKQSILAGQEGSFVIASNSGVFNDDEIDDFVARGYMTPVYKMTANEIKDLDSKTRVNANKAFERAIASKKKTAICSLPKGKLNQCAWTCQNNPKGEKRCRTDLSNVNCVRKRCNANGEWADELRLPSSYYNECNPRGVKVAPCNY